MTIWKIKIHFAWKHLLLKSKFLFLKYSYFYVEYGFYMWYWTVTNLQCEIRQYTHIYENVTSYGIFDCGHCRNFQGIQIYAYKWYFPLFKKELQDSVQNIGKRVAFFPRLFWSSSFLTNPCASRVIQFCAFVANTPRCMHILGRFRVRIPFPVGERVTFSFLFQITMFCISLRYWAIFV